MEPEERPPEEPQPPELVRLHPLFRAVLLLFGAFLLLLGLGTLAGNRLEYANWVHLQVVAPLAIVIGGIMLVAGLRGRIWA